jgi:hypothetical protein
MNDIIEQLNNVITVELKYKLSLISQKFGIPMNQLIELMEEPKNDSKIECLSISSTNKQKKLPKIKSVIEDVVVYTEELVSDMYIY